MATNLVDRAWMNVSGTPGTGNITLGSVVAGNQSFSDAGVTDGVPFSYVAIDGNDFEIGTGQSSSSVTTWQRTTVSRSVVGGTAGTSKLNLSSAAEIFLTARAADLADASLFKTGTVDSARLPAATTSAQGAAKLATASDEQTGTSSTVAVTPAVQQSHPSAAKVWVRFNSSGVIAGSYNVSSITDNSIGSWTVNFTTAFSSGNYSGIASGGFLSGTSAIVYNVASLSGSAYSISAFQSISAGNADPTSTNAIFFQAFGGQ